MKVAMVAPPQFGNAKRGTDFYSEGLVTSLRTLTDISVEMVPFQKSQTAYQNFDLIHYPYFTPFFLTLPFLKSLKTVITVHDLIPFVFPQGFPVGPAGWLKWQVQKRLLLKSDAIICDSLSSKKDICRIISYPSTKVFPIYLGIESDYQVITDKKRLETVKKRYDLPDKFVLYVGDINYHKNILTLLGAFRNFLSTNKDYKLLLVGGAFLKPDLKEAQDIRQKISELDLSSNIKMLGFIPTTDLVCLYNLAMLYVHPAVYEGFGLTVLQALASGCVVVSGLGGSLAEIVDDAIIAADMTNSDNLTTKLSQAINLPDKIRDSYVKKGLEQTQKFSWEKCAQETYAVYKRILEA